MQLIVWLALGALGLILTMGTINSGLDNPTRVLAAAFGAVVWGLWAMSATNVETVTNCCTVTYSYQPLFIIGLVGAVMHGLFFLRAGLLTLTDELDLA